MTDVTVSGVIQEKNTHTPLGYVNVVMRQLPDSSFVAGTITDADGRYAIGPVKPGEYVVTVSFIGYEPVYQTILVGKLSAFLELGLTELEEEVTALHEVTVTARREEIAPTLEKKTFSMADNINQGGGSLLQVMKNLPGVTVTDEGTVMLRGSDKVAVLIDGKQTALTGFGSQRALENIPASAIERIEVINNPGARYDANGHAGIINIIFKKETQEGLNGKAGMAGGLGALWIKQENLPSIRPQYQATPKLNPSLSLNYRKKRTNLFLQVDDLYTRTLNKNEFVDRYYDTGDTVRQQTKRNRTTNVITGKGGIDWFINDRTTFTTSALYSREKILDRGDEPFFNGDLSDRLRLWQFLEDEVKTTITEASTLVHKFSQPGRQLAVGLNYTFHREDEKYFFTNTMPSYTGKDAFKLLSDEHVADLTVDYVQPLKQGRFESGLKFRQRFIPTNMRFIPGLNSPLDVNAGGWADYSEVIPAVYANYVYESRKWEMEAGIRMEYVNIYYKVNPNHNTYKSNGYDYAQPFPNVRLAYKLNDRQTFSFFYNRRVDRPNEVDIRIFPKYDDAEIIKVGNPGLRPQFTNSLEVAFKASGDHGYLYASAYHRRMQATITRIGTIVPNSTIIYNVFQNAGRSYTTGVEVLYSHAIASRVNFSINVNAWQSIIEAFSVVNQYPQESTYSAARQEIISGSVKGNLLIHLPGSYDLQLTTVYAAPDVVPQGKTYARFYVDGGVKRSIQKGRGELFLNATDMFNTLRIKKRVSGNGFHYTSSDYYETQVIRLGYSIKF